MSTLTDYEKTVWEGSDQNAQRFALGAKLQTAQTDIVTLQDTVAAIDGNYPTAKGYGYIGTRTVVQINALTPATGMVVVAGSAGTPTAGTSSLLAIGDVAEYDGTNWIKIVSHSGGFVPSGTVLLVAAPSVTLYSPLTTGTDGDKLATFDGTTNTPVLSVPADGIAYAVTGTSANAGKIYQYQAGTGWSVVTTPLSSATPQAVGTAAAGSSTQSSRADHVHAHGNQLGGALHANAIGAGAAGFMSGADKTKLDGAALVATLASTANGEGASDIGFEDAANTFTAVNVEAAIAEARAKLSTVPATTVTIAGGVLTVTQSHHYSETEAAAASDDIDTITGLQDGQLLILGIVDAGRNSVLKHGTGNIRCPNDRDVTIDTAADCVLLVRDGAFVYVVGMSLVAFGGGGPGAALASSASNSGASLVGYYDGTHNKIPAAVASTGAAVQALNNAMPFDSAQYKAAAADRAPSDAAENAFATTYTLPANALAAGSEWRISTDVNVAGVSGSTPGLLLKLKLDGNAAATATFAPALATDRARLEWVVKVGLAGASGVAVIDQKSVATTGAGAGTGTIIESTLYNFGSFDTTATHVVTVTAQWDEVDAANLVDLRFLNSSYRLAAAVT
jgi:hypothetical protein